MERPKLDTSLALAQRPLISANLRCEVESSPFSPDLPTKELPNNGCLILDKFGLKSVKGSVDLAAFI